MKLPSAILLSPDFSARPVDARWQRIMDLADRGEQATHQYDDRWVGMGLAYVHRLQACVTDADRERLAREMSHIHAAHQLHKTSNKLARGIVEARLLAGQTVEDTAVACGLAPDTVQAYERLFFAVVGLREHWAYLMCEAIGEKGWYGLKEEDVDVILKRLGLLRGPLMVDQMVHYYTTPWKVPEQLDELTRDQVDELAFRLQTRTLILAMVLPCDQCHRAVRLYSLVQELRSMFGAGPGSLPAQVVTDGGLVPLVVDREALWSCWRQVALDAIAPVTSEGGPRPEGQAA